MKVSSHPRLPLLEASNNQDWAERELKKASKIIKKPNIFVMEALMKYFNSVIMIKLEKVDHSPKNCEIVNCEKIVNRPSNSKL